MARPIDPIRPGAALAIAASLAIACGRAQPRAPTPAVDPCSLVASTTPVDSASIVVVSPIDSRNAQRPTTWGERFVFGLAFDTVPRVDCRGQPVADAAGPYRVRDIDRSTFLLEPLPGARGPRLIIRAATEANARDLIDAGADLVLTEAPTLATYAATRGDVVSVPLRWDRTWVFVTTLSGGLGLDSSSTLRSSLARDVAPADARAAEGPFWWDSCGIASTGDARTPPAPTVSRIVYGRDDAVARALAERLVALTPGGVVASGLAPNAFASALRSGGELGYVFSLPRAPARRCTELTSDLLSSVPWLPLGPVGTLRTPLIDTRLRAVAHRDRLNLTFARDTTIILRAGRP